MLEFNSSGFGVDLMSGSAKASCCCGSGYSYAECCMPLHQGLAKASTALALMRSRYSAYALGLNAYIVDTQRLKSQDNRRQKVRAPHEPLCVWTKLEIIKASQPLPPLFDKATVEFKAHYQVGAQLGLIHEKSTFKKIAGRWFYIKGIHR